MLILQNNLHTKINLRPQNILNIERAVYIYTVDRLKALQPS
jgi:hypothetical protein